MDYKFQRDHSSTLDESTREGEVGELARGKPDEERLRMEVRTVFFSFALAGAANAILGRYVGSFYFAAIAALIAAICALLFLIMLRR